MRATLSASHLMLALYATSFASSALASDLPRHRHRPHAHHHAGPATQPASLRLPPAPYSAPTVGAAPIPNENVPAPRDRRQPEANVAPAIFALHYPSSGDGYIAGSSPSTIDNEHAAQIGGVQVQVPLH